MSDPKNGADGNGAEQPGAETSAPPSLEEQIRQSET